MKKILMIVAIAAVSVSFVACGGKKAQSTEEATATEQTETKAEEKGVLAEYEALIDKAIEIAKKMKDGDMDAVAEYQKLSEEITAFATKHQEEIAKMTPEELQKFNDIAAKMATALQ